MKIYKLIFNAYTNGMRDTVSSQEKIQPYYITCRNGELLVGVENISQLNQMDLYGKGIKTIELVGYALVLEEEKE